MTIKKASFLAVTLFLFSAAVITTSCNNDAEKAAPVEEKKTETAAPATSTPPDTMAKPKMDTASTRPTKPGA